ncbi:hypothetical protein RJO15_00915 [Herbaspirillum huttiense F1]|uniref:Uncharacterized protein n=1 Tax=Herbaspirillum huttiense subsp. lycopersici TaxID=3074428 RepID=A0ABU2ERE7_9BURK|nr:MULTISPECIES: hypothetical protein [Herbaspirillum]MDR6739746.1 hypothetical protein [Herbaspirillum sp. 1173]MDR9850736.1 hypothetical protein [Herbaspirillum huttiense SE1]MDT0354321.1 hypothetical protein [Herbaspirillum huttiense F1]
MPIDQNTLAQLTKAFPSQLREYAALFAERTRPITFSSGPLIEVKIEGENLELPVRIYQQFDERVFKSLPVEAGTLYTCILTRHHDGYIRQRQLANLFNQSQPWIVPFVIWLASEYVIEILYDIEKNVDHFDAGMYAQILRENPAFYAKAKARMISYWDCYYRRTFKYKNDYVGFRLFSRWDRLVDESKKIVE